MAVKQSFCDSYEYFVVLYFFTLFISLLYNLKDKFSKVFIRFREKRKLVCSVVLRRFCLTLHYSRKDFF